MVENFTVSIRFSFVILRPFQWPWIRSLWCKITLRRSFWSASVRRNRDSAKLVHDFTFTFRAPFTFTLIPVSITFPESLLPHLLPQTVKLAGCGSREQIFSINQTSFHNIGCKLKWAYFYSCIVLLHYVCVHALYRTLSLTKGRYVFWSFSCKLLRLYC